MGVNMFKLFILSLFLLNVANATDIIRIEYGKEYSSYSKDELKRRVWNLERAVWQLQQKVFELEMRGSTPPVPPTPGPATWICKTSAMGEKFSATGVTKAIAEDAVIEKCNKSSAGSFHCATPTCSQ
jgi:hypothetical protein